MLIKKEKKNPNKQKTKKKMKAKKTKQKKNHGKCFNVKNPFTTLLQLKLNKICM